MMNTTPGACAMSGLCSLHDTEATLGEMQKKGEVF